MYLIQPQGKVRKTEMVYENKGQIIKEIKKAMIDAGKTQEQLASDIGISRQALSSVLRKQHLSFDDCVRIIEPLGYKVDFKFIKAE